MCAQDEIDRLVVAEFGELVGAEGAAGAARTVLRYRMLAWVPRGNSEGGLPYTAASHN